MNLYILDSDYNVISSNQFLNASGIEIAEDNGDSIGNLFVGNTYTSIVDNGTNTQPNGAVGTNSLAFDDLNYDI